MDPGSFRVIEQGMNLPILDNASYTLIHKKYSSVFLNLSELIILIPVVIHNFIRNSENTDYIELKFTNAINTQIIRTADSTGLKVWIYNGHLFVSGELKRNSKVWRTEIWNFILDSPCLEIDYQAGLW
jgi:hypothetical protein